MYVFRSYVRICFFMCWSMSSYPLPTLILFPFPFSSFSGMYSFPVTFKHLPSCIKLYWLFIRAIYVLSSNCVNNENKSFFFLWGLAIEYEKLWTHTLSWVYFRNDAFILYKITTLKCNSFALVNRNRCVLLFYEVLLGAALRRYIIVIH